MAQNWTSIIESNWIFSKLYLLIYIYIYIANMGRCDHFILLSLYKIFIFMQLSLSVCHFFFIKIF